MEEGLNSMNLGGERQRMNLVKHLGIKCMLLVVILLTQFYTDSYISRPFTYVDLIAIIIVGCIVIPAFILYEKITERLKTISLAKNLFLAVLAFFIAIIFTGLITGEMKF